MDDLRGRAMINSLIIAVKWWGGMDESAQKDEISAFLIPVDPLTRWLVRRKQFSPWRTAFVTLLVLYLPIAAAVSIRGLWYSFNVYLPGIPYSHRIGLLGDEIWLFSNLFLTLPSVFLFFQLPVWLNRILHAFTRRMAARGIPAGELVNFMRRFTRTIPGWIVCLLLAVVPGLAFVSYNEFFIDSSNHWFRITRLEPYLVAFWTLVAAMLLLNIGRVLQWASLLLAMRVKFRKG